MTTVILTFVHATFVLATYKYYISTLGGEEGLKEMLILLMWFRGKMFILLMQRIKILIHVTMAFKSVKYHLILW